MILRLIFHGLRRVHLRCRSVEPEAQALPAAGKFGRAHLNPLPPFQVPGNTADLTKPARIAGVVLDDRSLRVPETRLCGAFTPKGAGQAEDWTNRTPRATFLHRKHPEGPATTRSKLTATDISTRTVVFTAAASACLASLQNLLRRRHQRHDLPPRAPGERSKARSASRMATLHMECSSACIENNTHAGVCSTCRWGRTAPTTAVNLSHPRAHSRKLHRLRNL